MDRFGGGAEGDAAPAGAGEVVGGGEEQVVLPGPLAEGGGVGLGRLEQQVEGAAGLHAGVAHAGQAVVEQVPVGLVDGEVGGEPVAGGGHPLEQAGGVDVAQHPAGPADGGIERVVLRGGGGTRI